jgi:hypothetical protein
MQLTKIISTAIEASGQLKRRLIKITRFGTDDVQEPFQASEFGIDSNPPAGMVAVYSDTSERGKNVIIGYLNKNMMADVGETRLFSVDGNGDLKAYLWLKNDGTLLLSGNADNAVRYTPMAQTIQELQNDIKNLKQAFTTWTPVPDDGGAALKGATSAWASTQLIKDISASKINTIQTP